MTDKTDALDPDAFVIIHRRPDGTEPYGIGPFPPIESLATAILANPSCGCALSVVWIRFPTGIKMALDLDMNVLAGVLAIFDDRSDHLN